MKADTIKLYWIRPDFALDDHVWKQHVVVVVNVLFITMVMTIYCGAA